MLRLFALGRRRRELTRAEYHGALLNNHAPLVKACEAFRLHCFHYHQNHVLGTVHHVSGPLIEQQARFDNCSEFWFPDLQAVIDVFNSPSYLESVRPDEKNWTDADSRTAFVGNEVADDVFQERPGRVKLLSLSVKGEASEADGKSPERVSPEPEAHDQGPLCLRQCESQVLGVLDFAKSAMAEGVTAPFSHVVERWFESSETMQSWIQTAGSNFPSDSWLHLWANEHVIF